MLEIIHEVDEKNKLWATKGNKSAYGNPHDYCTNTFKRIEKVESITTITRRKLNDLFVELDKHITKKVEATSEKDLLKSVKRNDYVKTFDKAIDNLKAEVARGEHRIERDATHAHRKQKQHKYTRVLDAAQGLTGLHRGELAVVNAWAE